MLFSPYHFRNDRCNAGGGPFKHLQKYSCVEGREQTGCVWLNFQAHLVAAFEQSLGNMTIRLQSLTMTAEQKASLKSIWGNLNFCFQHSVVVGGEKKITYTVCLSFLSCGDGLKCNKKFCKKYAFFSLGCCDNWSGYYCKLSLWAQVFSIAYFCKKFLPNASTRVHVQEKHQENSL